MSDAPGLSPKMFVVPAMMLSINYAGIDLNTDDNKLKIQMAFAAATTFTLLLYAVIAVRVWLKGDTTRTLKVQEKQMMGENAGEEIMVDYNYKDYDLKQIRTKLTTAMLSVVISGGIHYKWGMVHPLLIQAVLQPMNALGDPLAQIWLMGSDDTKGSTKRPFAVDKPPSMFAGLAAAADPKKAEEKEAGKERKARGAANKSTVKRRIKD